MRFALRRFGFFLLTLWAAVTLNFMLPRMMPGNPALSMMAKFHGRLTGGRLVDLADGDDPKAKIRLTTSSDDLVALVAGDLDFGKAWASGRLSLSANPWDLLKLRKLL